MARSAASGSGGASAGVKGVAALVFVIVMALVVLLLVRARPAPDPFDPRSGQPSGARGLVLTLQAAGADVDDTQDVPFPEENGSVRVLVLDDRLDDEQRNELLDFAEAGGVVVVADPDSTLHGGSGVDGGATPIEGFARGERRDADDEANVLPGRCSIAALSDLRGVFVPDGVLFPVGPEEPQCFTEAAGSTGSTAFVIVRNLGAGLIVGLGDNDSFTNRSLRRADNAGVLAALLVPDRGAAVTFLVGRGASQRVEDVGSGDETLRDLVPTWVWMSLVLGAVAFVVFAVSRSARVGRIVDEPLAAPIAGSELVSATGNLMQRAGHSSRAGWLLLEQLHRDLCSAHGVDVAAPLSELDRAVAQRSGTPVGEIEYLLRRTVGETTGLADLTARIDSVRRQVFGDHVTAPTESNSQIEPDPQIHDERVPTP
jgi:hypothetical protein